MLELPLTNGSQFKNPDISGALYTFRIQFEYTQSQCEDGARDLRVLLRIPVTYSIAYRNSNCTSHKEINKRRRINGITLNANVIMELKW